MTIKKIGSLLLLTLLAFVFVTGGIQPEAHAMVHIDVDGGSSHTIVLKADGTVWTWGYNRRGQLGDGTYVDKYSPVKVPGLNNVKKVAAGTMHSLALKYDDTLWAWGYNWYGQLGDGSTDRRKNTPVQVMGDVSSMSAGLGHTVILKNDGTVWACGDNNSGQLGNGTTTSSLVPVQVSGLTDVIAVSAGWMHNIALKSDGTVWGWGFNSYGQLGVNDNITRYIPVQMQITDVVSIDANYYQSYVKKSDDIVWGAGYNVQGQLGTAIGSYHLLPIQIIGSASQISGGRRFGVVIKNDDSVWVWGENDFGIFGDGTSDSLFHPASQVPNFTDVSLIGSGGGHNIAVKNDGTILTWGYNNKGQLGDGTTVDKHVPTEIPNFNLFN